MHLQTSAKKTIQDTAETTVDLVEKKKMQRRLQRLLQNTTCEDPSKLPAQIMKDQYNQYKYQKRSISHQKDVKKLLMDFYYHSHKYIQREWCIRKS